MSDPQAVHIADQLAMAIKEVLAERGLKMDVKMPDLDVPNGMGFIINPVNGGTPITPELMESIVDDATKKIGGTKLG